MKLPTVVRFGVLVSCVIGMLGASSAVRAADLPESMTLSPTEKHIVIGQGETKNDSFIILNDGQVPYDFTVYGGPYSVKGEEYAQDFTTETANSDAYKWIQFEKTTWHLEPGKKAVVPFTIRVGTNVPAGGHYGVIFIEQQIIDTQVAGNKIERKKRLGLLLHVNVGGVTNVQAEIKNIGIVGYQPSAPLTATARVSSSGTTDFKAGVTIAVMDVFGNVRYQAKNEYTILPNTTRLIEMNWPNSPWFGLYKVHMDVGVPGDSKAQESYVVIAPRWLLFIAGLVVLLGAASVIRRKQTHRR
ncbi:MAG: hypothetical protein WAQ25_02535 [Candidatus Saccharimonas sp.]